MKIENGILLAIEDGDIKDGVLSLPKTVKEINDAVINYSANLSKVHAPGLIKINDYNFKECGIIEFKAPLLKTIGNCNFYECLALSDFKAPKLEKIGNDNFYSCYEIKKIIAPFLIQMGEYNFCRCTTLTSFYAPLLIQMGNYNFHNCIYIYENDITKI